jgi:hypothetical protein
MKAPAQYKLPTSLDLPSSTRRIRTSQWLQNKDLCLYLHLADQYQLIAQYSIIAIAGLDGDAYGSWQGRGNLGRMWLRDFLPKDLPQCRTMIYGYNSKLSSHGVDTILELIEEIKKIGNTKEVGDGI